MDALIYKNTIYGGGGVMRGNYFDPIIYSTEERVVGVWVDNKPLYQKTIVFGSITNRSSISIGVENVEHISVVPDGSWVNDGERPLPYVIGSDASNNIGGLFTIGTSDTSFDVQMGNGSASDSRNGVITVQYTKTTDVAGSGKYTTLGVPAHHYDGNEKVVGTYFGETLYERTLNFTPDNRIYYIPNTTYVKKLVKHNGECTKNNFDFQIPYYDGTDYLSVGNDSNGVRIHSSNYFVGATYDLTIQYTKTTT